MLRLIFYLVIEYTQKSLTYKATNLANNLHKNHRKPVFIFGLGMLGKVYKKISMGFEVQRKVGQEFDMQIPINAGYPSLENHRIKVGTSHWAALVQLVYEFDILKRSAQEISLI